MALEARFVCDRKTPIDQVSVQLVLSASKTGRDNTDWAPFTPSGFIDLVANGPAGADFAQGKRYRVVIEEVGPDE